jgi:hypothetical protein
MSESSPASVSAEETNRNGSPSANSETPARPEEEVRTAGKGSEKPTVDRADEMVDAVAKKVAVATTQVGKGLLRFLARVREEVSDIWAEAQNIRRGDRP